MNNIRADSPYNALLNNNTAPSTPPKARPLSAERRSPVQVAEVAQRLFEALRVQGEKVRPLTR